MLSNMLARLRKGVRVSVTWGRIRSLFGRRRPAGKVGPPPDMECTWQDAVTEGRRRVLDALAAQDRTLAEMERMEQDERRRLYHEGGEVESFRRHGILAAALVALWTAGCADTVINIDNVADQEPGCASCDDTADPAALNLRCPLSPGESDCRLQWDDGRTYTVASSCDTVPSPQDILHAASGLVYDPCLGCQPHRCTITVGGVTITQKFKS